VSFGDAAMNSAGDVARFAGRLIQHWCAAVAQSASSKRTLTQE
jgi:hypothetical protein